MRAEVCPFAEFRESPNFGIYEYGKLWLLEPKAIVPHSADSGLFDLPPSTFYATTGKRQSTHFWIVGDGRIIQMVRLSRCAWGNGGLTVPDIANSPNALVRYWYNFKVNPNRETISVEFAGQGLSRPGKFSKPTAAQVVSWKRLCQWLLDEGWLPYINGLNTITHGMISNTACPDGRFTAAEMAAHLEGDDMFTKNHEEMLYGIVDLLLGRANGVEYVNDIERLIVIREAVKNDMRYNLGLSQIQKKVADLAHALSELTSERASSSVSAAKFAELAASLDALADTYRQLAAVEEGGAGEDDTSRD